VVTNLALIYIPVIMVLYGAALGVMTFYNITRESHQETLRTLAAKAQAAEDASTSQIP
jgi:Na+/melibiose symporter-like transporter